MLTIILWMIIYDINIYNLDKLIYPIRWKYIFFIVKCIYSFLKLIIFLYFHNSIKNIKVYFFLFYLNLIFDHDKSLLEKKTDAINN